MNFTPEELCSATMDYSRKSIISKGGFGTVYKRTVRGSLNVAIKVLNKVSITFVHILFNCKDVLYTVYRLVQMQYWQQSPKVRWNQRLPTLHSTSLLTQRCYNNMI